MNSPSRAAGRIDRRARRWTAAVICAAALLLAGCAPIAATGSAHLSSSPSRTTASAGAGHPLSVVALGDSVPSGAACGCTPFPELSASLLAAPGTGEIPTADDAVDGATSTDVLTALLTDREVQADIAAADVVEIEVGANDVDYSDACGTTVGCYEPTVPTVEQNVRAIVAEVHALTLGHPALVVLLDYWNVWLGGTYAAAQGQAYVDAATAVTDQVNTAIRQVAADTGSTYVDVRAAFKGPDYTNDETRYLAPDGDHPNARGHATIAQAVVSAVRSALQGR
ncbi:MAG TPA: SGNH/GDSL hydrolase family protein [Propionicimonas sp.]|jgi:lysophospholipase L1-like esterase